MPMVRFAITTLLAFFAALCTLPAQAQAWPSKPIRIVIPFPPGGATDVAVRPVADLISQALGQPVIIENRGGASGSVGAAAVLRSPADGYTLLATADVLASTPHLYKLSFDPAKDFVPVVQLARQPVVLAVHPSLGVATLSELVAVLKKNPGMSYATGGAGSQHHFAAEWFAHIAGVTLTHVPYKGGAPAIADVIGGQVMILSMSPTPVIPHYKAGKLKILAQSTKERAASLPEVPTFRESGVDLELAQWMAVFAPAGTPPAVVQRVNAEVVKVLAMPALRERYASVALEPVGGSPEELGEVFRRDYEKIRRLTKELNVRAD